MKIVSAKKKYNDEVVRQMREKFKYGNIMSVPKISKVVVNVGTGKIAKEGDKVDEIFKSITDITGQKPVKAKAKVAISGFKLRQGMEVGVRVTLRGKRMWQFIDRTINVALPRTRDFQGISQKAVDAGGNLNIGIKEHPIFPEIVPEKVKNIFSFQINVVTTAKNREEGMELCRLLGFPIRQN